jgi:hypothetical protein
MNFNIRSIEERDLPEIARWFDNRKWPLPPVKGVGPRIGVVAEKNGVMYACIYSYLTGTSVVYLEWPGLNPDAPISQAMEAMSEVIDHFKKMCDLSDPKVRVLSITTPSFSLSEEFKKHGFRTESGYYKATWMLKG